MIAGCLDVDRVKTLSVHIRYFVVTAWRDNANVRSVDTTDYTGKSSNCIKACHNSSSVSVGHGKPNDHILKSEETVGHFSHNSGHSCDVHTEGIANDLQKSPSSEKP